MSIISISGKIESGKDTIGNIIQYLTSKHAGIHTLKEPKSLSESNLSYEDFSKGFITPRTIRSNWQIKKFAYKLKQICSILTGIPIEDFEKQEVKDRLLGEEWSYYSFGYKSTSQGMVSTGENLIPTVRWLLQTVGTEAMRNSVHDDIWINALFADYTDTNFDKFLQGRIDSSSRESLEEDMKIKYPNWIITDLRFPNELEAIKKRNGITIRVSREGRVVIGKGRNLFLTSEPEHPSETALDNSKFDYTIDNNGTIEELIEKIREILTKEKII